MPPPVPALPEEAVDEPTPELLEEILEQIFLRLPPYEPACLVRASLASKHWLALLAAPSFRGRYREHHGPPPMLGFLDSFPSDSEPEDEAPAAPHFVSTTGFRPRVPDGGWGHRGYTALDCRHGNVLLCENIPPLQETRTRRLAVWDPVTGRRRELQEPEVVGLDAAALLCAVSSCDHLACHEGPFRVVHLSLRRVAGGDFVAQACVSSPETYGRSKPRAQSSDPCPGVSVGGDGYIEPRPPALVNNALHFMLAHDGYDHVPYAQILKYDLSSQCLSLIDAPQAGANMVSVAILMAMENGSLGLAHLERLTLFIWSRQTGSDGVAAWTQPRVINLENLLPIQNPREDIRLLGSIEGSDIIFVSTDLGIYKIDLKSLQQKKISSNEEDFVSLIPYMSFCNPREKGETL